MSLEDIRNERIKKLELLKEKGIDPYPSSASRDFLISEVLKDFTKLSKKKKSSYITGRIMAIREHGGSIFFDINDGSDQMQAYIKKDEIGDDQFSLFKETVDLGDFVELKGSFFVTKKKEKTLKVSHWKMLSKSLRPLPTQWYGLKDTEERFRKRYLDMIFNENVRKTFIKRTEIIKASREFFEKKGYLEVETPILQPIYGGGLARPFKTHHNALDIPLYLRISDELYLKRLIIGGFDKIYEICRDFRNEGIDHFHNPEFTLLEPMTAYKDYNFTMNLIEEFYEFVVKKVNGNKKLKYKNIVLDFKRPWQRISMKKIVLQKTGFNFDNIIDLSDAKFKAKRLGISDEKAEEMMSIGEIMNLIFEEKVQPGLIQPTIIYDYPVEISPLAKRSLKDPRFVERFEQFIWGQEHGNNYSELNDPIDLKTRFIEESKKKKTGSEEAHQTDEDFLEAIEYGMPPVTGGGISIDRLVMLLTGNDNIRDVIMFPTLRPKNNDF
ncbi:lysine--tRNA ligase [Patescibacteria group bacterium]|nr:lysine--tRNA ligase [Patescibacteria group bacterium]